MKVKTCPNCGSKMKKNGTTCSGKQRWRCTKCNVSRTHSYDNEAKELAMFVSWLLSKETQIDMPGQGRTFRRHTAQFWKLWPMPDIVDEVHRVIYVDGIWLARDVVILIACSDSHVLSWYLARAETSQSWIALLSRIAPPDVVVTDGGTGFAKAVSEVWPNTRVQRCLFHAFCQVKRYTTSRPKLQAGYELYNLSKELMHIDTIHQAEWWIEKFMQWCDFWCDFLEQISIIDGKKEYTHYRLRKARSSLVRLINAETLFTYLDVELTAEGPLPRTNNKIESTNSQLRAVLRNHRGLNIERRIKAVYWWCYMHTEMPKSYAEILKTMPTDDDIEILKSEYSIKSDDIGRPQKWGEGLVWNEFHTKTPYPYSIY